MSKRKSAKECAQYVMDQDCEHDSYEEYISEGHDPRSHILYHAAVVLGTGHFKEHEFEEDIKKFKEEQNNE